MPGAITYILCILALTEGKIAKPGQNTRGSVYRADSTFHGQIFQFKYRESYLDITPYLDHSFYLMFVTQNIFN